jgi:hypothetical protein
MHYFTSVTTNYLPKARVLAKSLRKNCDDVYFTLVVSDDLPNDFMLENEPFDQVLYIEDLNIPVDNLPLWIFLHNVVELCTAVKGAAILKLLQESSYDKVVYLDPDIAVFSDLTELSETLDKYDIVLTPHMCIPEPVENTRAIMDNEICSLRHGIYNLGFIALKRSKNALAFAQWWRDRLVHFCYADIPQGLFTDQRWCDLVPAFFDGVYIEKSSAYNVATWNLNNRKIMRENNYYLVDRKPLQFYHFTGFDSGAQEMMMSVYGDTQEVWDLRNWYIQVQDENGQKVLGKTKFKYSKYSNGMVISDKHRQTLRRNDLFEYFRNTNPFIIDKSERCYYNWYTENINDTGDEKDIIIAELRQKILQYRRYFAPFFWVRGIFKKIRGNLK